MSYAVLKCYLIHPDKDEDMVFAIDLASIDTLDDFLKELFDRVPELRTQKFSMDYQGKWRIFHNNNAKRFWNSSDIPT